MRRFFHFIGDMTYIFAIGDNAGEDFADRTLHQNTTHETEGSALCIQRLQCLLH